MTGGSSTESLLAALLFFSSLISIYRCSVFSLPGLRCLIQSLSPSYHLKEMEEAMLTMLAVVRRRTMAAPTLLSAQYRRKIIECC